VKRRLFWIVFVALVVLHHDWWFWDDGRLLFGWMPVGLAYQAMISLAAVGLWAWAVFGVWSEVFQSGSPLPPLGEELAVRVSRVAAEASRDGDSARTKGPA
jgi:hypothetical protein